MRAGYRFVIPVWITNEMKSTIHCDQKKRNQNVFFVKLGWWWRNLIHRPLNKFAEEWCKPFPPQLNNVSTLSCETWNASAHVLPLRCHRKILQNLSRLTCSLQICQISVQLITACGKYCKRRCIKQVSLIWSYQQCRYGCCNDNITQLVPLRSQLLFQFVHISDAYLVDLLLQQSPHAIINCI